MQSTSGSVTTEPAFQHKFAYQFQTAAEAIAAYTPNNEAETTVEKVVEIATTDASNGYKEVALDDYRTVIGTTMSNADYLANVKFLRWYLVDGSGNPVVSLDSNGDPAVSNAPVTDYYNQQYTGGTTLYTGGGSWVEVKNCFANNAYGKVYDREAKDNDYMGASTDDAYRHMKFTQPSGATWSDYRLVAIMTTDRTGAASFNNDGTYGDAVYHDPTTMQLKYVFRFVTTEDLAKQFEMSENVATAQASAHQGYAVVGESDTTFEVDVPQVTTFTDWSQSSAFGLTDLNSGFAYTRFYLTDKTGTPINMATGNFSIELSGTAASGVLAQSKGKDGLVVCAPAGGLTESQLKVKVTGPSGTDWTKVHMVMVTAIDQTGYDEVGSSQIVVHEPTNLYSAWNVTLVTDAEDLFVSHTPAKNSRTIYQKIESPAANSFTVDLNHWANKIAADFGKTAVGALEHFYIRSYVVNSETGELVEGCTLSGNGNNVAQKYGLIWYDTMTGATGDKANALNMSVTLPSGMTQSDVDVVFVMTDDLTDVNTPDRSAAPFNLKVSSDPTNMKWQYTVKFITEEQAADPTQEPLYVAEATKTVNAYAVSDRIKLMDDVETYELKDILTTLYSNTDIQAQFSGTPPKYARFYLVNMREGYEGEVISDLTATTFTANKNAGEYAYKGASKGLIWMEGTAFNADDVLDVKFTKPAGYSWSDFNLACILTNDLTTGDGGYKVGNVLVEEPATMNARLIVRFKETKDHYSSDVKGKSYIETITHEHFATSPDITLTLTHDYADASNTTNYTDIQSVFTTAGTELGEGNFYVRWYFVDEDGDLMVPEPDGIEIVPTRSTEFKDMSSTGGYKVGKIWYSGFSGVAAYGTDLLEATVKVSDPTVDLNDYKVMCVLTYIADADVATYFNTSTGEFTKEPDLQINYTYSFKSEFAGKVSPYAKKYEKVVLLDNEDVTSATVPLFDYLDQILSDYGRTEDNLKRNLHMRWYVTDAEGNVVANTQDYIDYTEVSGTDLYMYKKDGYGMYWNSELCKTTAGEFVFSVADYNHTREYWFNKTFDMTKGTALTGRITDYKVVVVMSDDLSEENGQEVKDTETDDGYGNKLHSYTLLHEPDVLNMQYTFSFEGRRFIHYKGRSGRDYQDGGYADAHQQTWDATNEKGKNISGDIRQGVHKWEYDVYVKESSSRALILPIQLYTTSGQALEPRAYFRWYDWKTDYAVNSNDGSFTFTKVGSELTSFSESFYDGEDRIERDRGLFALNMSQNAWQNTVGVTFTANSSFATTYATSSVDIACDVSKYTDGLDGKTLIHEPTLSIRYIFHVYPAAVMATKLIAGTNALKSGLDNINNNGSKLLTEANNGMFDLLENKSRVAVSLSEKVTKFSLRFDSHSLENYYIWSDTENKTGLTDCNHVSWWAYYEDATGTFKSKELIASSEKRIEDFTQSQFNEAGVERYHVVGYVCGSDANISAGTGTYAAVAHYELTFVNETPLTLDELRLTDNRYRTDEYMNKHYQLANVLTFDGDGVSSAERNQYYSTSGMYDAPTSSLDNMSWMPIEWDELDYSYCYPQLADSINVGFMDVKMSPMHGDYMVLKSMNVPTISTGGKTTSDTEPLQFYWWNPGVLYDYTHSYTDAGKYGSFFYTDASDESRTIAKLPLPDTHLCAGSTIYFTCVIANMTGAQTDPQVLARVSARVAGVDVPIVAFHSGELGHTDFSGGLGGNGQWYQIYGKATIPSSIIEDIHKVKSDISMSELSDFNVEVINYANSTEGADYAIDQLSFWVNTANVETDQDLADCDDSGNKIQAYVTSETLQNMFSTAPATLYYRICDATTNEVIKGAGMYPRWDGSAYDDGSDASRAYGTVYISSLTYDATTLKKVDAFTDDQGFYKDKDGNDVFYRLFNRYFPALEKGKNYYLSVYSTKEMFNEANDGNWGIKTDACSTYSSDFKPLRPYVALNYSGSTDEVASVTGGCGAADVELEITFKYPDKKKSTDGSDYLTLTPSFDFFKGTTTEFTAIANLDLAIAGFRAWDYTTHSSTYTDYITMSDFEAAINSYKSENSTYAAILDDNKSKLVMAASTTFSSAWLSEGTNKFLAIPVQKSIGTTDLCAYIPFSIDYSTSGGGPKLVLGFDDVADYTEAGTDRVLRVGLEQLTMMKTKSYKLHVPVHSFKDKNLAMANKVYFPDATMTLLESTDPTYATFSDVKFGEIEKPSGSSYALVDKNHMYLPIDLGDCAIDFKEGYSYTVSIQYEDQTDVETSNPSPCVGELKIVVKVVPEFVTWNSQPIGGGYYSANWYNDANWSRSTRAELYKGTVGGGQNTATDGHPSGYKNNAEINSLLTSQPGFVPMKFTYVMLPSGNHAPSLINEPKVVDSDHGSTRQGGGFLDVDKTTLLTDRSPAVGTGSSKPTDFIYYDLQVRYGTHADGGVGCFGHRYIKDDDTWADQDDAPEDAEAKVFDCEKYYGNVCREIYFKPEAEILRQHRLTYEKAWVEKALVTNKWYLMSTPLKDTYAGDMYVPTSMTDYSLATPVAVSGRQVTEAFQPITFNTTNYSRTRYPIYQRSWGQNNGTVYTKENDLRANSYSALLGYTAVTSVATEWGHAYNDVQVPYNTLTGFSIRAHKKTQATDALIRLPKADTTFDYYDWSGASSDPAAGDGVKTVGKPNANKFVTDDHTNDGELTFNITDLQQIGDYVLIGNPYMASLNMEKFFEGNTTLDKGYWTYEASVASAELTDGYVKPMQAFFVKKGTATTVKFTRGMQIDGNFPTLGGGGSSRPRLTMMVTDGGSGSDAKVEIDAEASADYVGSEDVEALFDSNLADVPMVFTLTADGQTASVDVRPKVDLVTFGVVCATNEPVCVVLSGVEEVSANGVLYVVDALTGEATEVGEGAAVTVVPNEYGRYFLSSVAEPTGIGTAAERLILVSIADRTVSVSAADDLRAVRVTSVGGAAVYSTAPLGNNCTFSLPQGIYVIEVRTAHGSRTVKVAVR